MLKNFKKMCQTILLVKIQKICVKKLVLSIQKIQKIWVKNCLCL